MSRLATQNRRRPAAIAGWVLLVSVLILSLSLGGAVHNHALFGADASAEKVSQSKYTCPACVFDGNPITATSTAVVTFDSGTVALHACPVPSFERVFEETSPSRAPPVV